MASQSFAESPRRTISIRAQLALVTGIMLVLGASTALAGYVGLVRLQRGMTAALEETSRIRDLALGIETEFLLARQSESNFLLQWRSLGLAVTRSEYVETNQLHIAQTRAQLETLEELLAASADPQLAELVTTVQVVGPLIEEYQSTFQQTVEQIGERSRSDGLEDQLNEQLMGLEAVTAPLEDPTLLEITLRLRANEQSYFATGRQEYVDTVRLLVTQFEEWVQNSEPEERMVYGTVLDAGDLIDQIQRHRAKFIELVVLDQNIDIGAAIFRQVTEHIDRSTSRIVGESEAAMSRSRTALRTIQQQSTLILFVTAVLAIGLGGAATFVLARRISGPLEKLSAVAEAIGGGDLEQRVTVQGGEELVTLAQAFNSMADQLRATLGGLEQQVAERTAELERRAVLLQAAAEVSRDAAVAGDLRSLLDRTVRLISERFGFYHAGIFLLDGEAKYAILVAASSSGGQRMLSRSHKLGVGTSGIVGWVTSAGRPRIAFDVGEDATYFDNPDLPDTRSEMALPLKVRGRVIGALDVQSPEPAAFSSQDVTVLQAMADQLAVAIDNTRLVQEMQQTAREAEIAYGRYTQEVWRVVGRDSQRAQGYRYWQLGVEPVTEQPPEVRLAWLQNRSVVTHPNVPASSGTEVSIVAVPMRLREQVIGVLNLRFEGEAVSAETLSLLEEAGERLALALESARLFEDARLRAQREQLLGNLSERFSRSLDLDVLLQEAVRELGQLLQMDEVTVHVGIPETAFGGDRGNGQGRAEARQGDGQ